MTDRYVARAPERVRAWQVDGTYETAQRIAEEVPFGGYTGSSADGWVVQVGTATGLRLAYVGMWVVHYSGSDDVQIVLDDPAETKL